MANNPDLPQELFVEIFSRLPTKSVGKFRCLSKTWNTQLSNSLFIKLHQKQQLRQENLIILSTSNYLYLVTPTMTNNKDEFSREIVLPGSPWTELAGSCNGLVLLLKDGINMFVVNPVTRQQVAVPNPPSVLCKHDHIFQYGFGYGDGDFKVFTLTFDITFHKEYTISAHVYCMKTRVWKTLDYPFGCTVHLRTVVLFGMPMLFVHGALHYFTNTDRSAKYECICAFDLATESFRQIPLPEGQHVTSVNNGLAVIRGCLAIISNIFKRNGNVWVMNEYGVRDSWVNYNIPGNFTPCSRVRPMCFVEDEEMLCVIVNKCWAVHDLKEGTWKQKVDGPVPCTLNDLMAFEESLVSPE